jgi:tetratricopeptide (TPR) repeat protein
MLRLRALRRPPRVTPYLRATSGRAGRLPRPRVAALLAALLLVAAPSGAGAEEGRSQAGAALESVLADLSSPLHAQRRAAVERLALRLPEARAAVIAALSNAPPEVRLLLAEVLARDASPEAVRALLDELRRAPGPLAIQIRAMLLRDRDVAKRILEAWGREPSLRLDARGEVSPRVRELEDLLTRAEVEHLFLSRKSSTGPTGYYPGQYDALLAYRRPALDLVVAILADRPLRAPGRPAAGPFRWLRPPPEEPSFDEIQGMAANAFSELATPLDTAHVQEVISIYLAAKSAWQADEFDLVKLDTYSDLLLALHAVVGDRFPFVRQDAEYLVLWLQRLSWGTFVSTYAAVLLRLRRYEQAIQAYEDALRSHVRNPDRVYVSSTLAHYNMACAYASWAEQTPEPLKTSRLERAMNHLEQAVGHQWSDIGWMEEDRDLDPLRAHPDFAPRYRALIQQIRRELGSD